MGSVLTLFLAKLLEIQFRRTFCYTNACTIVSTATLATLKPDKLPFTLFFSHKIRPHQAGSLTLVRTPNSITSVEEPDSIWLPIYPLVRAPWSQRSGVQTFIQRCLGKNLSYYAGTNCSATFSNGKTKTFFHSDWGDNLHFHRNIIARHTHLCAFSFSTH